MIFKLCGKEVILNNYPEPRVPCKVRVPNQSPGDGCARDTCQDFGVEGFGFRVRILRVTTLSLHRPAFQAAVTSSSPSVVWFYFQKTCFARFRGFPGMRTQLLLRVWIEGLGFRVWKGLAPGI